MDASPAAALADGAGREADMDWTALDEDFAGGWFHRSCGFSAMVAVHWILPTCGSTLDGAAHSMTGLGYCGLSRGFGWLED